MFWSKTFLDDISGDSGSLNNPSMTLNHWRTAESHRCLDPATFSEFWLYFMYFYTISNTEIFFQQRGKTFTDIVEFAHIYTAMQSLGIYVCACTAKVCQRHDQ